MSCLNKGSSGVPGLARAVSTLAGATSTRQTGCPQALDARWYAANSLMRRHCHRLVGKLVCFLLIFVSRLVDHQFRLYHSCCTSMGGDLAKIMSEA